MQEGHPQIALVGAGMWGRNIARVLAQLGALNTICDANAAATLPLAAELGAQFTTSLDSVLENPAVKALAIATPAATHAKIALQALRAQKDIYIEKPIALSSADAEAVADQARKQGRILMVGHLLRYHPGFVKLLELLQQGALGNISYVYSNRLNQGRIRTEENALWSLAPHDFSMLLAVANSAPTRVSAKGSIIAQEGIADISVVHLDFANGSSGHIFCSWLSPYKEHKLVVIGSKAMAVFDDTARDWASKSLKLLHHTVVTTNGVPEFVKGAEEAIAFEQVEPLANELLHFLRCVDTRSEPLTGAAEALPVLKALELAEISMKEASKL